MAEPFNIEQYRQQVRGETPQAEPQIQAQQPRPQQQVMSPPQPQLDPQPHAAAYQQPQQPMAPQQQPAPQQLAPQQVPANSIAPQAYTAPPHPQPAQVQTPHVQVPQVQPRQMPPHMVQQSAHMQPVHQMPHAPAFAPQPNMVPAPQGTPEQAVQEAGKKSLFNFKRGSKLKAPKINKAKTEKTDTLQTATTPPVKIFIFGMACGIICCLIGSMILPILF